MAAIKEKIAYLRGMLDSTEDIGNAEKLKAVMHRLIEVLDDLADDVEDLYYGQDELEDYLEALDADLADLEEYACECHDHEEIDQDFDDEFEMVEIECPNCQNLISFEEGFLYDDDVEIACPECGEIVYSSDDFDEDDFESDEDGEDEESRD
ncbi:MAG: hypothetical protein GX228_08185 [Firmicutes bacterium]|nr:hypothetical protein [Bacillota bacterium]NLL88890.1 hypothetical protein [Bacillota bacterium]HKM18332.1 hypothetical protein [Limnochordia bacterium]